jgi:hypothetical protein
MEVHKLKQVNDTARIHFYNYLLQNVHDGVISTATNLSDHVSV